MHQDTHHYLLRGARQSDPGGKHLITQEALDQQEQIHTAREGCGESELWSRLYWTVRDCTSQRRFRNISPEHSAFMRSNDDPTAPGTDTVPPTTREADGVWRDGPPHAVGRRNARTVRPHWWDTRTTSVTVGAFIRNALHRSTPSTAIAATRSSPHKKHRTAQKSPRTKPRRYSAPQQQCREAITATAGSASLHKGNNQPAENTAPSASGMYRRSVCAPTAGH
ncbi:putative RNase H [Trypanosoma cruzi]|uniref:Putative RNase H n=1 Tax=Trypanosoma cruzi TaxID=5693 RepID=A0A2V2URA3_TRYCR|nr:putative RNase H [Trypanosoma cruzi]